MLETLVYPMIPQRDNSSVQTISREDYAWLAGITDGEGNLDWQVLPSSVNGKLYWRPKYRVINTDVRMISKISHILAGLNVVFFFNINKRRKSHYKDQLAIIVHSQKSTRKVLTEIIPYLTVKRRQAEIMLETIDFVATFPKGGNTLAYDYVNTERFQSLWAAFKEERAFVIEPSEIARHAGKALFLPDDMIRPAQRCAEVDGNDQPAAA